jgi:type I restriction enzyme S subunit
MIEGLQPYAEYKESGSKWLGDVPAQWEVRNLRTLISKRAERDRPDLPLLSVAREKGVFVRSLTDADENHNVIPDDLTNYKVARAGNLVINKMKAWQGSMGIAPCHGIVSPAYFVFDFRITNHAFGQRLLRSKPYVAHFAQASDGVRVGQWDLSVPGMRQIPVLVPSEDEQAAIVRFLDHANRKIDGFIRAKRKLIALLGEQKQAIIHRAVTRGLDPNAPLKPSGIPWLGDIPRHWEVAKFKHFFRVRMGQTFLKPDLSETGELPVLSATMSGTVLGYTSKAKARTLLKEGDLVIPARGNSIGYVALVTQLCTSSQTTIQALRIPNSRLSTRFAHLFSVGNKPFLYPFVQTAIPQITTHEIASNPVLLPPMAEQNQICAAVDNRCSGINTAIARTEREIALMQEYRTRLTADVVTGKLDVRPAAAQLPAFPAETTAAAEAPEELEPEEAEA